MTTLTHTDGSRLPGIATQGFVNGFVGLVGLYFCADSFGEQVLFKLSDAVVNLVLGVLKLRLGHLIVLLSLSEVKLQLGRFTGFLDFHVRFPVFNALGKPLLHKASVALQFVDLDTAHLLLFARVVFDILFVGTLGLLELSNSLIVEYLQMSFKIDVFLGAV